MAAKEFQVNFRVSTQGKNILYSLQDYLGLSQAGVLEFILREEARRQGWDVNSPPRKFTSTLGDGHGGRHG